MAGFPLFTDNYAVLETRLGSGKVAVIGAIARKGKVIAKVIENTDTVTLGPVALHEQVAVRSRKPVAEDAVFGLRAAGPALLSNTSLQESRPIAWNPETLQVEGAPKPAAVMAAKRRS